MKFLVMGSAPYMREWTDQHLQWFRDEGFQIIAINNAWSLAVWGFTWHRSRDFFDAGTILPPQDMVLAIDVVVHTPRNKYRHLYRRFRRGQQGTMLLNCIYWILYHRPDALEIVLIGCDLVYADPSRIAFYSDHENSKARNDPFSRYSEEELKEELDWAADHARERKVFLWNASEGKTFLPYARFSEYQNAN